MVYNCPLFCTQDIIMPQFLKSKNERKANLAFNEGDFLEALKYYNKALAKLSALCLKKPEDINLKFERCFVLARQLQILTHIEMTQTPFEGRIEQFNCLAQTAKLLTGMISVFNEGTCPYKDTHQSTLKNEIVPDIFKNLSWCAERISDCYVDYAEQEDKTANMIHALEWINKAITLYRHDKLRHEELIRGKMFLLSRCYEATRSTIYQRELQAIIPPYEDIIDPNFKIDIIYYHYLAQNTNPELRKEFNECYQLINDELKPTYEQIYSDINLSFLAEAVEHSKKRTLEAAAELTFFANESHKRSAYASSDTTQENYGLQQTY